MGRLNHIIWCIPLIMGVFFTQCAQADDLVIKYGEGVKVIRTPEGGVVLEGGNLDLEFPPEVKPEIIDDKQAGQITIRTQEYVAPPTPPPPPTMVTSDYPIVTDQDVALVPVADGGGTVLRIGGADAITLPPSFAVSLVPDTRKNTQILHVVAPEGAEPPGYKIESAIYRSTRPKLSMNGDSHWTRQQYKVCSRLFDAIVTPVNRRYGDNFGEKDFRKRTSEFEIPDELKGTMEWVKWTPVPDNEIEQYVDDLDVLERIRAPKGSKYEIYGPQQVEKTVMNLVREKTGKRVAITMLRLNGTTLLGHRQACYVPKQSMKYFSGTMGVYGFLKFDGLSDADSMWCSFLKDGKQIHMLNLHSGYDYNGNGYDGRPGGDLEIIHNIFISDLGFAGKYDCSFIVHSLSEPKEDR